LVEAEKELIKENNEYSICKRLVAEIDIEMLRILNKDRYEISR
jgi:hypothetical protein